MIKKVLIFLRVKLSGQSIWELVRFQIESFLISLFSYAPTVIGIVLRFFVAKILFLECRGFSWIAERVIVVHTNRIKLGENVGINSNTYINGVGYIDIGDFVLIGNNVTISSGQHPINGRYPEIYKRPSIPKKIIIERDVWIGAGAVIMPGITLGAGSVIGANAVVNRDTRPYTINVGIPAREIGSR
jgi:galactoside O-acetyltransferase